MSKVYNFLYLFKSTINFIITFVIKNKKNILIPNIGIKNVIYISCNPKSLLEDLEHILKTHKIINLAVFDQFPWTEHLEVGVLMESHTKVQ